jgi:hypothetical protein
MCCSPHLVRSALADPSNPVPPREASAADAATGGESQATASPEEAAAPVKEQAYLGTNQCFVCHRPQTNTWSETEHVHGFAHLPEKYHQDPTCLECHVTGFGEAGGYVAGTDKDLLMVGCEACHGPGARHVDAAQRFVLADPGEEEKIEKEMRATIIKTPADSVCVACHIVQAHQNHPAFEGQPSAAIKSGSAVQCVSAMPVAQRSAATATRARSFPQYNVKTCGGCHYDEYRQWRTGTHSALAARLPAKHFDDQSCQQCHQKAEVAASGSTSGTDPHHGRIGVACESCHGPAFEHVRFNRQFIGSPPLGAKLEQAARNSIRKGKPETTCIQCHVHERHQEHPEFDAK